VQVPEQPRVFVSILNWNAAETTLTCLTSVLQAGPVGFDITYYVVDNGSEENDWQILSKKLPAKVHAIRLNQNIGFAGGHNVIIRKAIEENVNFIWLLNNDTIAPVGTLEQLLAFMQREQRCGSVSPVIRALHDETVIDFCGAWHDWNALESRRPNDCDVTRRMEERTPEALWNHGTAPLFRVSALNEIGVLDERYFAYFEDNDIGVRLSRGGWLNRVCYDARVQHARRISILVERPAYYFYLMTRNAFAFWEQHTAAQFRHGLRRRLLCRALVEAAKLRERGFQGKSDACLIGAVDGLAGRRGPPELNRQPPFWIAMASRLPYRLLKPLMT